MSIKTIHQSPHPNSFYESLLPISFPYSSSSSSSSPNDHQKQKQKQQKTLLLLTRQDVPELWSLDPITHDAQLVLDFSSSCDPSITSLTGICELSTTSTTTTAEPNNNNKSSYSFAVGAGQYRVATHEGPVLGSFGVFVVDLEFDSSDLPLPKPKIRRCRRVQTPGLETVGQLNGMCPAPPRRTRTGEKEKKITAVLVADSYHGRVYRVDLDDGERKGKCEIVINGEDEDEETLTSPKGSPVKMGVNGIKVLCSGSGREGGSDKNKKYHLYYTNTTRMLYCRVQIDPETCRAMGPAEILVKGSIPEELLLLLEGEGGNGAFKALAAVVPEKEQGKEKEYVEGFMPDDFCFVPAAAAADGEEEDGEEGDGDGDGDGSAYVTTHPTNMVMKVSLSSSSSSSGRQGGGVSGGDAAGAAVATVRKIAGGFKDWEVASATACAFGKGEGEGDDDDDDRYVLYVVTAGCNVIPIEKGKTEGAKVVAIDTRARAAAARV